MTYLSASIVRRDVTREIFEKLCHLCQESVQVDKESDHYITESELTLHNQYRSSTSNQIQQRFCLAISSHSQILIIGLPNNQSLNYEVEITFNEQRIQTFITSLPESIAQSLPQIKSGVDTTYYHHFISQLIDIFASTSTESSVDNLQYSVCKPVEDELERQISEERLLTQVIVQLHQSLHLDTILNTAVREIRSFFDADRLLIYQFLSQTGVRETNETTSKIWGKITYESLSSENIPSLLNFIAEKDCFNHVPRVHQKYLNGNIIGVADIEIDYSGSYCLIELLKEHQVKSKLIAPIVVQDKLWGLILVHQCCEKRQWKDTEKTFLGKIGEHLAVAIYQAQIYKELQLQKENIEQRVIERTRELRDSLLATQAAHQAKNEFIGNISHELRSPLTNVIGLSGTIIRSNDNGIFLSLAKQQKYLTTIKDSGQQLLYLLNEIIDFSQIESGKAALNIKKISLLKLAHKMHKFYEQEAFDKQINLSLDLRIDNSNQYFFSDADRLQQILFQLLTNAIKFTPNGGHIILRIWRENEDAVFQVEDTGIGIDNAKLPLLFETFQQLEKSRERIYGGTGLGLALTKQLVDLHQGKIEVESTPGEGSIFTVWLPNQPEIDSQKSSLTIENNLDTPNDKVVILFTRNEEIATLICELLIAANFQVIWLIDPITALDQIKFISPSAVIIDQTLSEVYSIGHTLHQLSLSCGFKTLLLGDKAGIQHWQERDENYIDEIVLLPIQPKQLLRKISTLLNIEN